MDMKRIEAPTLEEAYKRAAEALNCSVTEIKYEIVQYPSAGVMGLFKKPAIIIAIKKVTTAEMPKEVKVAPTTPKRETEAPSTSHTAEVEKPDIQEKKSKVSREILDKQFIQEKSDKVLNSFFDTKESKKESEEVVPKAAKSSSDDRESPENKARSLEIETKLMNLMKISCFDIDTVEVDVFNSTAHIFIDGEDAALLIGKEGYRYNALSYMLFNWINAQYDLYIKLEIAEFIQDQEEMIANYLIPIIEHINEKGRGKTKPLDGILVQIALEQLRVAFPNKYVAIKTGKDGKKFIIVNNFNSKKNA